MSPETYVLWKKIKDVDEGKLIKNIFDQTQSQTKQNSVNDISPENNDSSLTESKSDIEENKQNTYNRNDLKLVEIFKSKCTKCNSLKPPRTHHCSTCKRWIARMDHHWPWVNNWVGIQNQKHFLLFLFYLMVGCAYGIFTVVLQGLLCIANSWSRFENAYILALSVGTVFLQLFFIIFGYVMLSDQVSSIIEDTSTIDKLKKTELKKVTSKWSQFKNVFNNESYIRW